MTQNHIITTNTKALAIIEYLASLSVFLITFIYLIGIFSNTATIIAVPLEIIISSLLGLATSRIVSKIFKSI
jgi:hypothetical protein